MSVPSLEDASVTKVRPMEASAHAPILVVEDERDLAEEIRCELEAGGHPVTLSDTVEDALKAARAGGASVLVVDRMLHGEDGLSIVETASRGCLEFQIPCADQRRRRPDRQSASQARPDRRATIHRQRQGGRVQTEC